MWKWVLQHKYFEAAIIICGIMIVGAIGFYDQLHPTTSPREAVVEEARKASVKVKLKSGGHGSGVVLTDDGRIITNQHVCGANDTVTVVRWDDTEVTAHVLWHAEMRKFDLCLIDAEDADAEGNPLEWTPAEISRERMWAGKNVFHIGNPMNIREVISFGTLGRVEIQGWNKQPAYAYIGTAGPGSSGGGVFDMEGRLIGLIYSGHQLQIGFGPSIPLGVGHVLPSYMIEHLLGR